MTRVAVIDYGSGNLRSAAKAIERAGGRVDVTDRPEALADASHIVLPGVGAFADCARGLRALDGMVDALNDQVIAGGKPFLGICVGMQLMADSGREHGDTPGLGWIPGQVVPLDPGGDLKVPHMGWNDLSFPGRPHPLFDGIDTGSDVYFVHSFRIAPNEPDHTLATVDYGRSVVAAVGRENMVGTQFHPEKSQAVGLSILANFLDWHP